MIQIGPRSKVYVATQPVDFRKGFSGLSNIVTNTINRDPLSGHFFVFRNKRGTSVKIICFDGRICWTINAQFAQGKLSWWPQVENIDASQLMGLLSQSTKMEVSPPFREVS